MVGFSSFSVAATALVAAACVVAQDPSYKVPFADGSGEWADAYKKAKAIVATLSLEEKLNVTVTQPGGILRIGFPGVGWCDGPNGISGFAGHSAVPAALHAASTFDRSLLYDRAAIIGNEAYLGGCHVITGPMLNILRAPAGGRNFEGFGADPYLMSEGATESVKGIQAQGIAAMAKHYTLNNQEHGRHYSSSDVSDKTFREIYLPGFEHAVKAGVASVMCSYNAINGTYACEDQHTLGNVLKGELNFQGWVNTDYSAPNSTDWTFLAGTDAVMGTLTLRPPGTNVTTLGTGEALGTDLLPFVEDGTISLARVDDAAIRILSAWLHFGLNDTARPEPATNFVLFSQIVALRDVQAGHKTKIREIGAAGTVLLKNEGSALPLKKPAALAVFGLDAGADPRSTNLQTYGASANGTVAMGYGSGWTAFPYLVTPLDALTARAREDNTWLQAVTDNYAVELIDDLANLEYNSACLVFVNSNSGEEIGAIQDNLGDRNNLTAWSRGDALVEQVAGNCSNTVVVAHSPGALLMPWADHENISAIVWAGLPGQESGNALVDILYGDVNPSGRLAYTLAKKASDFSASVDYSTEEWTGELVPIKYEEGVLVDYRHFQANNIEPLYAFGHGLSYTSFAYSSLKVAPASKRFRRTAGSTSTKKTPYPDSLYDALYTVSATVKNTGKVDGHEVAQLYVKMSAEAELPYHALKGFERPLIKAGKSATVTFELRKRDVSYWSTVKQAWVLPESFEVYVGASSDNLTLSKKVTV